MTTKFHLYQFLLDANGGCPVSASPAKANWENRSTVAQLPIRHRLATAATTGCLRRSANRRATKNSRYLFFFSVVFLFFFFWGPFVFIPGWTSYERTGMPHSIRLLVDNKSLVSVSQHSHCLVITVVVNSGAERQPGSQ